MSDQYRYQLTLADVADAVRKTQQAITDLAEQLARATAALKAGQR